MNRFPTVNRNTEQISNRNHEQICKSNHFLNYKHSYDQILIANGRDIKDTIIIEQIQQ